MFNPEIINTLQRWSDELEMYESIVRSQVAELGKLQLIKSAAIRYVAAHRLKIVFFQNEEDAAEYKEAASELEILLDGD